MKQLGSLSSFGVDHVRSKQCMSQIVIADLCTPERVSLLWQWLAQENVVAIFLAPPCGGTSRARQIPLKRAMGKNSNGPLPLRDDLNPNGKPGLSFRDRQRISLANKLYHLTSQLVERANTIGCIVCVENPQFTLFWATTFWLSVAKRMRYSVFHSCQYGSIRKKKTMLAFNSEVFHAVSAKCKGQNSKHKHAAWGLDKKKFATSEETAYPMVLAKMLANCIKMSLINLGIEAPEETLHQLKSTSIKSLRQMKAATGLQPKASRIPPLVPTFKARVKLQALTALLPDFNCIRNARMTSSWVPE